MQYVSGKFNRKTSLVLGLLIFAVTLTTLASGPRHQFTSPSESVASHPALKNLFRHYRAEGFRRYATSENAYRSLASQDREQDWGTVVFQFSSASDSRSFGVTYVSVTAYVVLDGEAGGYQTRGFDVRQYTTD